MFLLFFILISYYRLKVIAHRVQNVCMHFSASNSSYFPIKMHAMQENAEIRNQCEVVFIFLHVKFHKNFRTQCAMTLRH